MEARGFQSFHGAVDNGFGGFAPGVTPVADDWNVDGPNVMRGSRRARALVEWMADAQRPQPIMADDFGDEDTLRLPKPDTFPHPTLALPAPTLTHDFRMSVILNPQISIGKTPSGQQNWISFTGGSWSGSFGSGIVVPGGQGSQTVTADLSIRIETNYLLQTDDDPPAFIVAKTRGWLSGPPEVVAALADSERADAVDPATYKFRLFVDLETGDERYRDLVNCGMWVGSGMRKGAEVVYDAYCVS